MHGVVTLNISLQSCVWLFSWKSSLNPGMVILQTYDVWFDEILMMVASAILNMRIVIFKCDMLALALLRIEIFLLLPSFSIETKSWQKHQSLSDSNNLADFNNVNKEFFPRKSSQKSSQKILPKSSSKKIPSKKFLQKNQRKIQKIQKIAQQFLQNS